MTDKERLELAIDRFKQAHSLIHTASTLVGGGDYPNLVRGTYRLALFTRCAEGVGLCLTVLTWVVKGLQYIVDRLDREPSNH